MQHVDTPTTHLIVCAHPSPADFGHAVARAYMDEVVRHGHRAVLRDLYAIGFDPVLREEEKPRRGAWAASPDVECELQHLLAADMIVLIYPIWFGLPPAMMKGYVDRVLGANVSFYALSDGPGQAALAGKPLLSFSTSAMPLSWLDAQGQVVALRQIFDVYLWRGLGMRQSEHVTLDRIVPNMSAKDAEERLAGVRRAAARACALLAGAPITDRFEA